MGISSNSTNKAGIAYQANDTVSGHNSTLSSTDSVCAMPTVNLTEGYIGQRPDNTDHFPMILKRFKYYTTRHSNSTFQNSDISVEGGGGGADALTWNPNSPDVAPLGSNFSTYNVGSAGGTINLFAGEKARIILNNGTARINGKVAVVGVDNSGNVIQIIGGNIRNTSGPTTGNGGACLDIVNVDTAYVEGVWCDKGNTVGDAFVWRTPLASTKAGTLYLQNCLATGVHYYTTGGQNHGDLLQMQVNQATKLYIDKFTGYTWSQGMLWNTGASIIPWESVDMRRVNLKIYDTNLITQDPNGATPPFGHSCVWFFDSSSHLKYPIKLSEVYVWDLQTATGFDPGGLNRNVRKRLQDLLGYQPSMAALGTYSGDAYTGTWTPGSTLTSAGWTGVIRGGIPAGGDFVSGGTISGSGGSGSTVTHSGNFTGLNYVSPGYL